MRWINIRIIYIILRNLLIGYLIAFLLCGIFGIIYYIFVEICLPKISNVYPDLEPILEPIFKEKLPGAVVLFLFGIMSYIGVRLRLGLLVDAIKFWKIAVPIISIGASIYILVKIIQIYLLILQY